MPLLDIVQAACRKLVIPEPAAVAANPDPQVRQMLALAIEECEEAAERHDWSILKRSSTWTVPALVNGVATLAWPADFRRMPFDAIERPFRVATRSESLSGPATSDTWSALLSGIGGACGAYWRPYGAGIQVFGAIVGETVAFDYVSHNDVLAQGGAEKPAFSADSDRPFLPERLVRLGVIWRWRQTKGFDYAEDLGTYEREIERLASADSGPSAVSTSWGDLDGPPLSFPTINPARA